MTYTREEIEQKLKDYPGIKKKISLLEYEQAYPVHVSEREILDAMNYAKGDGSGSASGHISNKTMYIALNYQQVIERMNQETRDDIACHLELLKREAARIEFYVSLLDQRQEEVIRYSYFEQLTNEEAGTKMHLAARTIKDIKKRAIDALTEMYNYISELQK